jgi:hypothetical protein
MPNTEVEFDVVGDSVRIRKAARQPRGGDLVTRMRGRATAGLTTAQIMAMTRG